MTAAAVLISLTGLSVAFVLTLIRLIRGPSLPDRVVALDLMAAIGVIPSSDARAIRRKAGFKRIEDIEEREKVTNHDVLAFLEVIAKPAGKAGRWIHQGLTSSDLLDTTLAVQMSAAARILMDDLKALRQAVARKALQYKMTPMIGRSHGIHAEPITFGLKLALMYDEFGRAMTRLEHAVRTVRVGKLSGAVGTHAHLDPRVERYVCKKLGLEPATLATQVVQRDRHAEFLTALALVACSIERWAVEFRHLQRTEVLEVEEFFSKGQKGSSAMPHKRNPIMGERLAGLARVLRGNALAGMENVALWHERDISHSSVERIILPDSCTLLDYMLVKLTSLVETLIVYPENMEKNLWKTKGLFFSQSILLALTRKGMIRQKAYEAVQRAAMETWRGTKSLAENLKADPLICKYLTPAEVDRLCDLKIHFRHINNTFRKLGLSPTPHRNPSP